MVEDMDNLSRAILDGAEKPEATLPEQGATEPTHESLTNPYPWATRSSARPEENYVAWLRYAGATDDPNRHLVLCDSNSPGAFKVYRWSAMAAAPLPAQGEPPRHKSIESLLTAFRTAIQNGMTEVADDIQAQIEVAASPQQGQGWVRVEDELPEDDSDVYAAIPWTHTPTGEKKYIIHDCSYYEGGTGSKQKIFTDCEGEEFEAHEVGYWIYKYKLAEQLPALLPAPPAEAEQPNGCSYRGPHLSHTFGGRPTIYCPGITASPHKPDCPVMKGHHSLMCTCGDKGE